jgi:hypothetical protein
MQKKKEEKRHCLLVLILIMSNTNIDFIQMERLRQLIKHQNPQFERSKMILRLIPVALCRRRAIIAHCSHRLCH